MQYVAVHAIHPYTAPLLLHITISVGSTPFLEKKFSFIKIEIFGIT